MNKELCIENNLEIDSMDPECESVSLRANGIYVSNYMNGFTCEYLWSAKHKDLICIKQYFDEDKACWSLNRLRRFYIIAYNTLCDLLIRGLKKYDR